MGGVKGVVCGPRIRIGIINGSGRDYPHADGGTSIGFGREYIMLRGILDALALWKKNR